MNENHVIQCVQKASKRFLNKYVILAALQNQRTAMTLAGSAQLVEAHPHRPQDAAVEFPFRVEADKLAAKGKAQVSDIADRPRRNAQDVSAA